MRKQLTAILALAVAAAVAVSGVAFGEKVRAGNLVLNIGGNALPRKLPQFRYAPITLKADGHIRTADGTHPPAARRIFLEFDRNGTVFTRGLPVCRRRQLENRTTRQALRVCKRALVGRGQTVTQVKFPDQDAFKAPGPMLIFNGPPRGRNRPTILIHVYANVPAPTAIVSTGIVNKRYRGGRYGNSVQIFVPVITGGFGSLLDFSATVRRFWRLGGRKRSYLYARCRDRRFQARGDFRFADGSRIRGTVIRRCFPRR